MFIIIFFGIFLALMALLFEFWWYRRKAITDNEVEDIKKEEISRIKSAFAKEMNLDPKGFDTEYR